MSTNLSPAFVTLFAEEVKQAYQAEMKLRPTVRLRTNVVGSTCKFPTVGKGQASVHTPSTDVTPLNSTFAQATATLANYTAAEYSSVFDQQKVNFSERQELVEVVSKAIGRRCDQMVIDALDGAGTSLTVANSIGGSNTNMNFAKVRDAHKQLNGKNVPASDRYLLMHANNLNSLLSESTVTSADYVAGRPLENGSIGQFMGFTIIAIGDMDEGGLAIDGSSDRTCLAWHKSAIGLAEGISSKVEINYVAEKVSWLINAMFAAGAVGIDASGICEITCRDTGAAS